MEKTKLESMQIVAKQKRMAAEQAELEALEVEKDVEAIEFEIEVIKRKGFIEEIFWRFPHIGEQILQKVDNNTLFKCLEINKWWKKVVIKKKICQINQLEKHTYIKSSILKKLLGNKDFETIKKLANYSMKVYKKVIIDGRNNNGIGFEDNDYRKHQEEILRYLFEKKHRNKIQHLLTDLMIKNTKKNFNLGAGEIQSLIQIGDFELLQMFFENFKNKMDHDNYRKLTFEFLLLSPPWCLVECILSLNNQKGHVGTRTPSYLYGYQEEAKVSLSSMMEAGKGPFKYYVIIGLGGSVQKMAIFAYYQYIEGGWLRKSPKTLHIFVTFSITSYYKRSFNN